MTTAAALPYIPVIVSATKSLCPIHKAIQNRSLMRPWILTRLRGHLLRLISVIKRDSRCRLSPRWRDSSTPGTVNFTVYITQLGGFTGAVTLSYSGAPTGVTIAFSPNPTSTSSTATVTVGALVPFGRYLITITGTSGTEVQNTNFVLIVFSTAASTTFGFELEDGTGVILLEDGSILLLENQS